MKTNEVSRKPENLGVNWKLSTKTKGNLRENFVEDQEILERNQENLAKNSDQEILEKAGKSA